MKLPVTGAAGFIGHFLAMRLLARGDTVIGATALGETNAVCRLVSEARQGLTKY